MKHSDTDTRTREREIKRDIYSQAVVFPGICEIPDCASAWRILINPSSKFKHLWSVVCRRTSASSRFLVALETSQQASSPLSSWNTRSQRSKSTKAPRFPKTRRNFRTGRFVESIDFSITRHIMQYPSH